ncbi:NADPH-dependent FMN reductase [Salinicoccus albus]|uniref:NADPH-dependent FMN reductase n=1 Tax=Salinicoccus albus TaxID=418756 RepID=UPI0003629596|nr:NADPH-dependent FMN reductase [Salinicoccus albus]
MNIVLLAGSIVGSKTRTALEYAERSAINNYSDHQIQLIDLAEHDLQFSDGRNYLDYEGDTGYVTKAVMDADIVIIGTPIFQASIPGTLKNLLDLLPQDGFRDKTVSMLATAGSSKHFMIPEQHLKPILGYMKAQIVQTYVYIEERNFANKEIIDDDVRFRINRLVEDTVTHAKAYKQFQKEKEASYGF